MRPAGDGTGLTNNRRDTANEVFGLQSRRSKSTMRNTKTKHNTRVRVCGGDGENGIHELTEKAFSYSEPIGPGELSISARDCARRFKWSACGLLRPGGSRIEVDDGLRRRSRNHRAHVG